MHGIIDELSLRLDLRKISLKHGNLSPNLEKAIPAASAESLAGHIHSETAHTIFVSVETVNLCDVLFLGYIPHEAVEVVIPGEQQATRVRGGNRRNATQDAFVREIVDFAVATQVEEPAVGIVGTGDKRLAVGEKLYRVDIGLMPNKCLYTLSFSYVPYFGSCVARSRHEQVGICRVNRNAHHISAVVCEGALC